MTGCGRASVILEKVNVDVYTNFGDTSYLENQCLVDDNPDKVTIHIMGKPEDGSSDIVIIVDGERQYPYGFLARVVNALDNAGGAPVQYENAHAYWRGHAA